MAGRTDVESALPTCGAVAMALLSIVIEGVKYAVIVDWIRTILRLGIVVRLNGEKLRCKMVVDEASDEPDFEQSPPFATTARHVIKRLKSQSAQSWNEKSVL